MPSTLLLAALLALPATTFLGAEEPASAATPENRPPHVIRTKGAVFPIKLIKNGVTNGTARIALEFDSSGRLIDSMIVAYTHREFAEEAIEVARQWRYEPALVKGQPAGLIADVNFRFEVDGVTVIERRMPSLVEEPFIQGDYVYKPCPVKYLDRIPTPRKVDSPLYPEEWRKQGIIGRVVVNFFIDESGKTRMPTVITAPNDMLASVAASAVAGWQFEPPMRGGRPTLVRVQQIFEFGGDAPKP
jgi:TonB family protein